MIRQKILIFILFLMLIFGKNCRIWAQKTETSVKNELQFIQHLITNSEYDDAVFLLNKINAKTLQDEQVRDTVNYLKGWLYYQLKDLDNSIEYLSLVSKKFVWYEKSKYFLAYNHIHTQNFAKAKEILSDTAEMDFKCRKLSHFELAGIALLERDFALFEKEASNFTYDYFPIQNEEKKLLELNQELQDYRKKSLFLAGTLSAIVPGAGKIYAGSPGQGIASFLTVGMLGALTAENYIKDGIKDVKTLFFGSLFCLFYLGNIYGSVYTLHYQRKLHYDTIDQNILFHIHIPLRTIFN